MEFWPPKVKDSVAKIKKLEGAVCPEKPKWVRTPAPK
jgi:hypothetical protein